MSKIVRFFLLIAVVAGISSCFEDKGNYEYTELTSLTIDTVNTGVREEMTAIQFENFRVPVKITYAGDQKDLSYEWRIYPQDPEKPEDVSKYDSAMVLYRQAMFDTVINEVPGKYYLTLEVKNQVNDTKEYLTIKLNVESALTRGLCVLDEKEGKYDLNMIRAPRLFPDMTAEDEKVYYHIYSKVNDKVVIDGKFLASYEKILYFFTENGGYCLNSDSYEISNDNYTSLFSFPLAIRPNPQAYMTTTRPMEVIVNDGKVYAFDHRSYGVTTFGDQLSGEYVAAPFLPRYSEANTGTLIYDIQRCRFAPVSQYGSSVGAYEDTPGVFNVNQMDENLELLFMENGFNSYTYAVFKNRNTLKYALYVANFLGDEVAPIAIYDMDCCTGTDDHTLYAFSNAQRFCFYASGSDLYQYNYESGEATSVHSFGGEDITSLEIFKKDGHSLDNKLLVITTYSLTGEGKVYLIGFDKTNGMLESVGQPYGGFGRIADVLYKEQ